MLEDLYAWVMKRGGSPWARKVLERERLSEDGRGTENAEHSVEEPAVDAPPAPEQTPAEEQCPRWMHHQEGVFCKSCGRSSFK